MIKEVRHFVVLLAGLSVLSCCNPTKENGRSSSIELPTMGWSSWNTYHVNISDSLIMRQADACVSLGLKDAGYTYINIDDGFFGGRDTATGRLLIHPVRFPNGLKPVADHIHSLGLKAGIYSDAGGGLDENNQEVNSPFRKRHPRLHLTVWNCMLIE